MDSQAFYMLLLEIGTEEIPARFIPYGINKLKENAEKLFTDYRFQINSLKTYGTPRRLSLIAEIAEYQYSAERELWGPPVHIAFDNNGNLTKAGESFLKNNNIDVTDIVKKEKNKGLYITAIIKEKANPIADLLPEVLNKLILSLSFPKSMRWGNGTLRFVRPIHWILAIYNNKKVIFEIEGIKSSNMTKGHRFLSPAAFEIKDSKTYINLLRNNFVILDRQERMNQIIESSKALAKSVNCVFVHDEELIEHITDLVDYPQAVLCTFEADYLKLPEELLIIVMKDHQKYIALRDNQGNLSNHFIVISNTKADNKDIVKRGAQKVLKARFEDARFYYEDDQKIPLKDRIEGLKKVVYHEKLGTLYDKSKRIERIALFLSDKLCPDKQEDIQVSASLCKTDLITGIVREFPELQGIMGGYYAKNEGYNHDIVRALKEQYLPRYAGDYIPLAMTSQIISIADKTDNLTSFFSIGEIPTSTEDPFALRRHCYGIVSMLMTGKYKISASELFEYALSNSQCNDKAKVFDELLRFFEQRVDFYMENAGYPKDVINSLLHYSAKVPLYSLLIRAEALKKFKVKEYYNTLLLGLKRINNIAPKSDNIPEIDESLFIEEAEKILFDKYELVRKDMQTLISSEDYLEALERLSTLESYINDFFDKVLVMDKREDVRQNRLSLVCKIKEMSLQITDFSKLL